MNVAFYGNNLNFGYFFVRMLRRAGLRATLICPDYRYEQERHDWWTDDALRSEWVYPVPSVPIGRPVPLRWLSVVRKLYGDFRSHDVLILAEEGPAVFSELREGPAKVFLALGFDLTHLPFYLRHYLSVAAGARFYAGHLKWAARGDARALYEILRSFDRFPRELPRRAMIQKRQRIGLRQCDRIVCGPHHAELLGRAGLDRDKVRFLPLPMDTDVLADVDGRLAGRLEEQYADCDLVFFHPTRHYFLREDSDVFLKGNDKLLYAFARFIRRTEKRVKLLLVRKGREHDIREAGRLIAELDMEHAVEWLPEMPNKKLRAYYTLRRVVVCDQYSPRLAVLGNIGREASYFGRPLITAFRPWNRLRYGDDVPEHVFAAETADDILEAMEAVAALTPDEREDLRRAACAWFGRNHAQESVLEGWIDLISSCAR